MAYEQVLFFFIYARCIGQQYHGMGFSCGFVWKSRGTAQNLDGFDMFWTIFFPCQYGHDWRIHAFSDTRIFGIHTIHYENPDQSTISRDFPLGIWYFPLNKRTWLNNDNTSFNCLSSKNYKTHPTCSTVHIQLLWCTT